MSAYRRGDHATAFREWLPLAQKGDASAQAELDFMCQDGHGLPPDDGEAAKWFRRAAEQDYADAQFALGVLYHDGRGMPQDDSEAAKWFRRATEQGQPEAEYNLGLTYHEASGCRRTTVRR